MPLITGFEDPIQQSLSIATKTSYTTPDLAPLDEDLQVPFFGESGYSTAIAPVVTASTRLTTYSTGYIENVPSKRPKIQVDFLRQVGAWASQKSFLGDLIDGDGTKSQGAYQLYWFVLELCAAILQTQTKEQINNSVFLRDYLEKLILHVWKYNELGVFNSLTQNGSVWDITGRAFWISNKNLKYYALDAMLQGSAILDNHFIYEYARDKMMDEIHYDINPNGTLDSELGRLENANHYHLFAAKPLIDGHFVIKANEPDYIGVESSKRQITRLLDISVNAMLKNKENSIFETLTGATQSFSLGSDNQRFAWAPLWLSEYRHSQTLEYIVSNNVKFPGSFGLQSRYIYNNIGFNPNYFQFP